MEGEFVVRQDSPKSLKSSKLSFAHDEKSKQIEISILEEEDPLPEEEE